MLGYHQNVTVDDGSCVTPVLGCPHPSAINFDSMANIDDTTCHYNIPGCTHPRAINFFGLAEIDDGSCIFIGCTSSSAPNFNPSANVDDGSCEPIMSGCTDSRALNYQVVYNSHDSSCVYGGCTNSSSKNYQPSAQIDDGSCIPYRHGCRDSTTANYDSAAERDGWCAYYGCTSSMAVNFDASASVDDGSCEYTSASGALASFGYLRACRVFVDAYGPSFSVNSERGAEDPYSKSSDIGLFTVVYREPGMITVQSAEPAFQCTDTVTGSSLDAPLRTLMNATMATPLTTVAAALVGASLSSAGMTNGEVTLLQNQHSGFHNGSSSGFDAETASKMVCRHLIPPISCSSSFQPCSTSTGHADVCSLNGSPVSVFHFDALDQYIYSNVPDAAWSAWLVGQINTLFSIGCAKNALLCASPELCGSYCGHVCSAHGVNIGTHSKEAVGAAIFSALAEMTALGPAHLEEVYGAGVGALIAKASGHLGIAPINLAGLTQSCGMQNFVTYASLTGQGGSGRRTLAVSLELPHSIDGVVFHADRIIFSDENITDSALGRVASLCDALQPNGGSCKQRLSGVIAHLATSQGIHQELKPTVGSSVVNLPTIISHPYWALIFLSFLVVGLLSARTLQHVKYAATHNTGQPAVTRRGQATRSAVPELGNSALGTESGPPFDMPSPSSIEQGSSPGRTVALGSPKRSRSLPAMLVRRWADDKICGEKGSPAGSNSSSSLQVVRGHILTSLTAPASIKSPEVSTCASIAAPSSSCSPHAPTLPLTPLAPLASSKKSSHRELGGSNDCLPQLPAHLQLSTILTQRYPTLALGVDKMMML